MIALIALVPIFSETIYTPALPQIARFFGVDESLAEYTTSIYFLGTSTGVLIWGQLSDILGRRPCLLVGLAIYLIGCLACITSGSIYALMAARLVQALGASIGSVLALTISYDISQGKKRGKLFSTIGGTISVGLAAGPVLGGFINQYFGWHVIFTVLMVLGCGVWCLFFLCLPETHPPERRRAPRTLSLLKRMVRDRKVVTCSLAIGLSAGMQLSYSTEGPFFMIDMLGLSSTAYGLSAAFFACFAALGAWWGHRMHSTLETHTIIRRGALIMCVASAAFASIILLLLTLGAPKNMFVFCTLCTLIFVAMGRSITVTNSLSLGIENFSHQAGAANALFICSYYLFVAIITAGMGWLHNDTLLPLPLYMAMLALLAMGMSRLIPPGKKK